MGEAVGETVGEAVGFVVGLGVANTGQGASLGMAAAVPRIGEGAADSVTDSTSGVSHRPQVFLHTTA